MSKRKQTSASDEIDDLDQLDQAHNVNHLAAPDLLARVKAAAPAAPETPATDGRRFRKSAERMTSVSIPRELRAELRRLTLQECGRRERRVATWELIAEAMLGADWIAEQGIRIDD